MAAGRNYERKGDPFTLKVLRGEGPPCVIEWGNKRTGRRYFTRVPVHRCLRLDAVTVAQALRENAQQLAGATGKTYTVPQLIEALGGALWDTASHTVSLFPKRGPPVQTVPGQSVICSLEVTYTGRPEAQGVRVWLRCPRCSRRCGVLYASPYGSRQVFIAPGHHVIGCRDCLGLTDESRQRRGCLDWASAVRGERPYPEGRRGYYQSRSWLTQHKASLVYVRSLQRTLKGFNIPTD